MALVKCSECSREVSDKAASCVGCGAPIQHQKSTEHTQYVPRKPIVQEGNSWLYGKTRFKTEQAALDYAQAIEEPNKQTGEKSKQVLSGAGAVGAVIAVVCVLLVLFALLTGGFSNQDDSKERVCREVVKQGLIADLGTCRRANGL